MLYRFHRLGYLVRQALRLPVMITVILFIWLQNRQWKTQ